MTLQVWRYQRFHVSYLLAWLAVGILGGLFFGRYIATFDQTLILFISLTIMLGAFRSQRWYAVILIVCAGVLLGTNRSYTVQKDFDRYNAVIGSSPVIQGKLTSDAQASSGSQKVTLGHIEVDGVVYPGELYATIYGSNTIKRGDIVTLKGSLRAGFASYGAAVSNGKLIEVRRSPNMIRDIREKFSSALRSYVIEPMASLGLGFVVGQRSTLPDELDEQLKIVGLTHIVVASGYNLTILSRMAMRLFARHSRYLALVVSLVMVCGFVLFSGFSPSMNRAVIVTTLSLLAWYVGRRFHPMMLIVYVAGMTAFYNPMYIWSDLGWYLSFFAFAGILIVAPLLAAWAYRRRRPTAPEQLVLETVSAELMALPLIVFAFSSLPVFGLFANVLVAPLIPVAMLLTALTGLAGLILPVFAALFALPTTILIGYVIAVVDWLAKLPFAQFNLDVSLYVVVGWYLVLAMLCLLIWKRRHYDFRKPDVRLEM